MILWIDASNGIAGDMLCGALLDAGAPLAPVEAQLRRLGVPGWELRVDRVTRGAFAAAKLRVLVDGKPADEHQSHEHRSWATIRRMIEGAELPPRARDRALATFGRLAEAEGRVHGMPADKVQFHEVGAVDSIIDIVGACLLLEALDVDEIVASPLPLGGGRVRAAHGQMAVPAPATVELLKGWPLVQDGRPGELVTPTGAALLGALARPGPMPSMSPSAMGFGAGTRDPREWSNTVRVVLGGPGEGTPEQVALIEAQVDDMSGELLPAALEALFAAGALDAWATPVLMKKGRPGQLISAICPPSAAARVEEALLRNASTFGCRRTLAARRVLARSWESVQTPWGPVRMKVGRLGAEELRAAPEYEDCAALAKSAGVPVAEIQAGAIAAYFRSRWP